MRVVRGEAHYASLGECGLAVVREIREGQVHWAFKGGPIAVFPTFEDLAAGVLRWSREALPGALWDASFGTDRDGELVRVAERIFRDKS